MEYSLTAFGKTLTPVIFGSRILGL
nr:hypothetical protein [Sphingobacterium sp.]